MKATKVTYFFSGKSKHQTVVLLHGYLENRHIWDQYHRLLDTYNLLIPDLPGFGQSPLINQSSETYISETAQQIVNLIEKLDLGSVHLVGNSMGGYVCLEIASCFPQTIRSLCLLSSTPFADSEKKIKQRDRELQFIHQGKKDLLLHFFIHQQAEESVQHYFQQSTSTLSEETMCCVIRSLKNRKDHCLTLQKTVFPIGFIYGADDGIMPMNNLKSYLRQNTIFSHCELSHTGHMAAFTKASVITVLLRSFFTNKILSEK
ncbi:MAG: alpha/beta hydrolase [Marinilabiliaceae bacterium]|nr:alpha/beta hydrolase [Marinilabiliaceae bacterium]